MSVSCIIPFYNERGRISHVVSTLLQSRFISQIICVDDGSTDRGHQGLTDLSPTVKVMRLSRNQGKAEAVRAGLKYAAADTILMMDADLSKIDIPELDHAIKSFQSDHSCSMLIFQMKMFIAVSRMIRGDILFSGIRLVRTSVLRDLFQERRVRGYQLELSLNDFCLRRSLKVTTYPFYAHSVFSTDKLGVIPTLIRDMYTYPSAISHVGLASFFKQLFWFGREEIKTPPAESASGDVRM